MLMPMCTSTPRAGAASNPAASAITNDVRLILRPPCVYYRQPGPASPALPSGAPNPEACRQRLVEQPRLLACLERHRLPPQARAALAVRRRLQPSRDPLAKGFVEIAFAVARRARELRKRERVGLGSRPRGAEKPLRPRRRRVAPDHAVGRAVERRGRAEPRQRPQLRLGRAPALGLGDEHPAQLGTRRGGETLAAPDRLPHLAQLLRARPRPPGLAAAEERRAHLLEEVLLLPRREAARDALPEVPPLGAALHGARVVQLGAEHAPEAVHAQLVARSAEAGTEEEAGEVQPARLVRGRARPRRLERPGRVPEPADRRHRPGVAPGAERRLEPARERDRIVTAREGGREEAPRLLDARGLDDQAGRLGGAGRLADRLAEAELEAPAMVGGARAAPDLERADLGQPDLEVDGERRLDQLSPEAEDGADGGQRGEPARRDDLAGALAAAVGRREQREGDGPVGEQLELGLRDLALLALLHAARHEAERAPVAEPEVVGARRAAADAHAQAAAREPEVRRAARDGELQRLALEHRGTPPAVPGRDHVAQARAHDLGLERAAVEEERVGARERQVRLPRRRALPGEELGQVARDLRLLGEGQPPLARREPRPAPRAGVRLDAREEAVEHGRLDLRARERGRERAADDRAAAARHREPDLCERRIAEQALLRAPALAAEAVEALRVELAALREEPRLDRARQGEVDVVAAEEE